MTPRESELLENSLDALDRLYDWKCGAFDVWALFVAIAEALQDTPHRAALEQPLAELRSVVWSGMTEQMQRDRALDITDSLRQYLTVVLPHPLAPPGSGPPAPLTGESER